MTEKPSEKHTPATDKPAAPATDETGGVVLSAQPPLSSAPPPKPRAAESSQPVRGASQPQASGQPQASQAVPAMNGGSPENPGTCTAKRRSMPCRSSVASRSSGRLGA